MNFKKFLSEHANIKAENKILKFFIIVIGIVQIINIFWNYTVTKSARTIIIPTALSSKIEISDRYISEEGAKYYTRYIIGLALNYTPATARGQFEELLTFYTPDEFPKAKATLYSLAEDIENAKVSSSFYIQKIILDHEKRVIEVIGLKRQYTNEVKIKETTEEYIIEYVVQDGRFLIKKLYQKEDKRS